MSIHRPRLRFPSPALIVSCMALFAAVGGGAYAATANSDPLTWHPLTPAAGWANVPGYVAGSALDSIGVVHLRGAIKGGPSGSLALTLPASERPAHTLNLPITTGAAPGAAGRLEIMPNGKVFPIGVAANLGAYTGLDGISFGVGE